MRRSLKALPFFTVLFIIMGGCTWHIGGYPLLPALFLIPVYYWLIFRPDWLPLGSLFVIGLFYDALLGYELGFSSFLLMVSAFIGQYVRPFLSSHYFSLIWCGFGLYSFGYILLYGVVLSGGGSLFISWMYGVILYPLGAWALNHLHLRLQANV